MHKKIKILISLCFIFGCFLFFQNSFGKYVIEDVSVVAKLNIDRSKPNFEFVEITSTNRGYTNYSNSTYLITATVKLTENNIVRNNFGSKKLKISVDGNVVTPTFKYFNLVSQTANEKIYEFCFTNVTGNGDLIIEIPEGLVEDNFGLTNDKKVFSTDVIIDNIKPVLSFEEIYSAETKKSVAKITSNEPLKKIDGWNCSENVLTKEFSSPTSYELSVGDLAGNYSKVLVAIKKANSILLDYKLSPNTIYTNLSGDIDSSSLESKYYFYNSLNNKLSNWINYNNDNKSVKTNNFTNLNKTVSSNISGIQFKLNNNLDYSIVYQSYVKDIGWLKASFDGQNNLYDFSKPISNFRMNIIPKSEKQYLVDYWNKDVRKTIFY